MLLSVIVPAYKEPQIFERVCELEAMLKSQESLYDFEIIVVVDGKDSETWQSAQKAATAKIRIEGYEPNKGKGYAVRYGMARAKGEIVAFIDGGLEISPASLRLALEHFQWYNADVIVGSKYHPASKVGASFTRRVVSRLTHWLVRVLFGLRISDTQAGLKIFRREVLEAVLPRLLVKRWAFDVEMLAVAHYLGFRKIYEAPIELYHRDFSSKIRILGPNGMWKSFLDTLAIYYRMRILHYYDDSHQRKWVYDNDLDLRVNVG